MPRRSGDSGGRPNNVLRSTSNSPYCHKLMGHGSRRVASPSRRPLIPIVSPAHRPRPISNGNDEGTRTDAPIRVRPPHQAVQVHQGHQAPPQRGSCYEIIRQRGLRRGVMVEVSAMEYLEDGLRHDVDSEFSEMQFDPKSESPGTVEFAYWGNFARVWIDELSTRTGLSEAFLAELSQAGQIPGPSTCSTTGSTTAEDPGLAAFRRATAASTMPTPVAGPRNATNPDPLPAQPLRRGTPDDCNQEVTNASSGRTPP